MTKFRVLAELSQIYEVAIEAENEADALVKAKGLDISDFNLFNDSTFENDWIILENSAEALS